LPDFRNPGGDEKGKNIQHSHARWFGQKGEKKKNPTGFFWSFFRQKRTCAPPYSQGVWKRRKRKKKNREKSGF